jgi:putative heme-binding domain-containing protein
MSIAPRRNWLAWSPLAWSPLAWSLGLPLATMLAAAAFMSIPPNTRGIDTVAGGELFTTHCASCHFTRVGLPAHLGPNLHEIGSLAATRKPNQSAAEYILESILDPFAFIAPSGRPIMPPNVADELDPNEIRNLVGYLASRGAFPDYDEIARLEIPDRRSEHPEPALVGRHEMELAESVLRDKGSCLNCHSLYHVPEGKTVAPGLFGVGLKDARALHESIIHPHQHVEPQYRMVNVLLEHGEIVSGQLVSRSDESLTLRVCDDQNRMVLRDIPLADIEKEDGLPKILPSNTSMMPAGFDKTLTPEEINAVINLIRQLN